MKPHDNWFTPQPRIDRKPAKIAVFDTETTEWDNPYAVAFYDGQHYDMWKGRDCIRQFVDAWLVKDNRSRITYAHNGGRFDFGFILDAIDKKQYSYDIMRAASRIMQIDIHDDAKHKWTLRDSYAMLPMSLKKLTKAFGVSHEKGDVDHSLITDATWQGMEADWKPYLERDVKGTYEVLTAYDTLLRDNWKVSIRDNITLAKTALAIYRSNHMTHAIPTYKSREDSIRLALYGGRTEIFERKWNAENSGKKLYCYDIRSSYPYVMHNNVMPVGTPLRTQQFTEEDYGVAHATVHVPKDMYLPPLPHRSIVNGNTKLLFPTGRLEGWWCSPELQYAASLGCDITYHEGYIFEQANIFKSYVDDLYERKRTSDPDGAMYVVTKLLMNSLFGKTGQRRERDSYTTSTDDILGAETITYGNTVLYKSKKESQATHILPAIAAMVTAHGRINLHKHMLGHQPYYTDTDSVYTTHELPTGDKLGDLNREHVIDEAYFLLPKTYACRYDDGNVVTRCKGFPKDKFPFDYFRQAFDKEDMSVFSMTEHKMLGLFESLRRYGSFAHAATTTKTVHHRYDKRTILEDKSHTMPLVLAETIV